MAQLLILLQDILLEQNKHNDKIVRVDSEQPVMNLTQARAGLTCRESHTCSQLSNKQVVPIWLFLTSMSHVFVFHF